MRKTSQRNWLLILTSLLLISSGILVYISLEQQLGQKTCSFNGVDYTEGNIVPGYEQGKDCICNSNGMVECSDPNISQSESLSDFTSSNLNFFYDFINLLEQDTVNTENIETSEISLEDSKMVITLNRESLCTSEEEAPVSVGFYNYDEHVLKLTTLTNRDVIYTEPCLVENKFEIASLKNSFEEDFQIYFQTEEGKLFNLNICVDSNRVFSDGDVFQSEKNNSICTCEQGSVVCN